MIRRAILSALSSACHAAGEALASLQAEPDAQPAEKERAELLEQLGVARFGLEMARDEARAARAERDMIQTDRDRALSYLEERDRLLNESICRIAELKAQLAQASYWKRGEPGERQRQITVWHQGDGAPYHLFFRGALPTWALPGWYAEALGPPPSEEAKS